MRFQASPLIHRDHKTRTRRSSLFWGMTHCSLGLLFIFQTLKTGPRAALQQLAEPQLWRLRLLHSETIRASETALWMLRVRDFDKRQRSGPKFVIGRAPLAGHDADNASTSLLWMPLVAPLDPPTHPPTNPPPPAPKQPSPRSSNPVELQKRSSYSGIWITSSHSIDFTAIESEFRVMTRPETSP